MRKKDKELVPIYQMEQNEAYLLLRLQMKQKGNERIAGMKGSFYEPATYKHHEKLLKSLEKRKYIERPDGSLMVCDGLLEALGNMQESSHCLLFRNPLLQKNEQTLSFYYANGKYVGFLQDKKKSVIVCNEDPEAVYFVFQKQLTAEGMSSEFKKENWQVLWTGAASKEQALTGPQREVMENPIKEAILLHTGNLLPRKNFSITMIGDGQRIHMLRSFQDDKFDDLERIGLPDASWHRIIVAEIKRLKEDHNYRRGIKEDNSQKAQKPLTDYQKIIASPGFPRSRTGFLFWMIKNFFKGLPSLIKGAARKKFLGAILAVLWGVVIFLYNMYITCFFNDTFMLERRARLGNLSPYVMGATLSTPNKLKGFDLDWGVIETTFLVAPMLMLLTLLGRHIFREIRTRKLHFLADVVGIISSAWENKKNGFGKGRNAWLVTALAFVAGFFLMNPITLFLTAIYAFLIFAQGNRNDMVRYIMLYKCAGGYKKISAGRKEEPDFRSYTMFFYRFGCGMLFYAFVSLGLWFLADYHFWIRLVVTVLMVVFALLQAFMPQLMSKKTVKAAGAFLLMLTACWAVSYLLPEGIVLADDGGISESGDIWGLIQNAGFSTILGITIMTLGIALGGPAAWMIAAGAIAGGATFITGLLDTGAGEYVRKSARQFFTGAAEGESKTLLCAATELGSFIAGFVNPAAGANALTTKAVQISKLGTDTVMTTNDIIKLANDFREGADWDQIAWDAAGVAFDVYGFKNDISDTFDEFAKINQYGDAYKYADSPKLNERIDDIETNRKNDLQNSQDYYNRKQQSEINEALDRHTNEIESLEHSIRSTESGEIEPPRGMTKEEYVDKLKEYQDEATKNYIDEVDEIKNHISGEADEAAKTINKNYDQKKAEEYRKESIDWGSKAYEAKEQWDKTEEYYDTNFKLEQTTEAPADSVPEIQQQIVTDIHLAKK